MRGRKPTPPMLRLLTGQGIPGETAAVNFAGPGIAHRTSISRSRRSGNRSPPACRGDF
jgi:hypothetical protein